MTPIVVIPARRRATRLPDKPLADVAGKPMIVHVWRRAVAADAGPVVVACDDDAVGEAVAAAGGEAVLTEADLASGSDRAHQAVQRLDPDGTHDVVVNLQGDLPTIDPASVRACLDPLAESGVDIATIAAPITDPGERDDPNVVKVAAGLSAETPIARALYFSRAIVPYDATGDRELHHHIGVYAYRRAALTRFVELPPSPLERREKLEQLRALEAGMRIDVARVDSVPLGVDTPADLARARELLGG
ncbi:3-deoxy-manno-octulosonate cytidylyltransferase (CMP-KDO synthetase) [Limimonas halophila]|uniref:3-deoxy-manno-octulosonate cytidylyltransferase n=1 Tax=Limimonas halophila TaxID=1082479 RepID=A0A1G7U9H6_9PROT|nr:3-deoxy-manno-octulosonate cytidylyltransferase [Limimonas halophila]SDG44048.1 3-deoxy-manno-octulosonate cytidylyltransferase (CMP-KDO synthetase) [Limimonas halophila]